MLSRSQERLLRHLGTFPDALSQAWDVPRDVSLPGLSDAMGVVRSGLNQPLTALLKNEYITVRVAHVIGGGSRRRPGLSHHGNRTFVAGKQPVGGTIPSTRVLKRRQP